MKPLVETNKYMRKASVRNRILAHNALESSVFEGARGLGPVKRAAKVSRVRIHAKSASRLSKVSRKKSVKGS